jgi:hypothetical protein
MQQRLLALGLVKKPVTEREKRRIVCEKRADEIARLMNRYDRGALYEQVWSQPVLVVVREYRISGATDWGLRGAVRSCLGALPQFRAPLPSRNPLTGWLSALYPGGGTREPATGRALIGRERRAC